MNPKHLHGVLATFLAFSLISTAWTAELPPNYSAALIRGRIVDAVTGDPIAGAAVVAAWHALIVPVVLFHGSGEPRTFYVQETLSDTNGYYRLPGWGPLPRPLHWEMDGRADPLLWAFKPGYEPVVIGNDAWRTETQTGPPYNSREASILKFKHDGKDIALYSYGKAPEPKRLNQDIGAVPSTPEQEIRRKVGEFAAFLDRVVSRSDDDEARGDSPRRLAVARKLRLPILMADTELKKLPGQFYSQVWGTAVLDLLREERNQGAIR